MLSVTSSIMLLTFQKEKFLMGFSFQFLMPCQRKDGGIPVSKAQRKFVETVFEMETDMRGTVVKRLGFHSYLMKAEDGKTYQFKC